MRHLYFVTIRHGIGGETLMGGHWYADDASEARVIAAEKYATDRTEFAALFGKDYPPLEACEVTARTSKAYANALN